ncbi:hypothetical protein FPE01S_03_05380 [Flavihumibacter petaseus NBRC 106054]|uniref:DinB-like domain-containing protein n=2 Tax=Flavihumibacter TaxID=1004301 RepID=A0A0E9N4B5_9BACT|nr:hypothetical protein FPE01S_03_05380 [Flavihumibacter petaseus NBRC 106054]
MGAVDNITPLLQPVAHALLQARDEINTIMADFDDRLIWKKPAAVAAPAFHLKHMAGVLDRLFTYAAGNSLSNQQLEYLRSEEKDEGQSRTQLLAHFNGAVERSLETLRTADPAQLANERKVGRKGIPSTVLGLYFHAAEHTMRHTGQLLVTVRILVSH